MLSGRMNVVLGIAAVAVSFYGLGLATAMYMDEEFFEKILRWACVAVAVIAVVYIMIIFRGLF